MTQHRNSTHRSDDERSRAQCHWIAQCAELAEVRACWRPRRVRQVAMAETLTTRPSGLSGNWLRNSRLVRRAQVGELREQVFVGPDLILGHLSI